MGEKAWATARAELVARGLLSQPAAVRVDGRTFHSLVFDLTRLAGVSPPLEGSRARDHSSRRDRATPTLAGIARSSPSRGSKQDQGTEPKKQQQGGPKAAAVMGEASPHVAPAGAWDGLGFSDKLLAQLALAGLGAGPDQLAAARAAFDEAVARGRVKNPAGYALELARKAGAGEFDGANTAATAMKRESSAPASRRAFVGHHVRHPMWGLLEADFEPSTWRRLEGGGGAVSGAAGVEVWRLVDAGELTLRPGGGAV